MRSKFFLEFVKKMEKLKLSLSKPHDKMLKMKSEMLKIRKNVKIIKREKISRENFPEIFRRTFSRPANGPVLSLFSSNGPLTGR